MGAHPLGTYRLQLHPGFDFDAAAGVVDYLAALGVTHVYLSPVLQAAPGSTHGYDVVDHSQPSDQLAGWDGHARLASWVPVGWRGLSVHLGQQRNALTWGDRGDSNPRPSGPQPDALTT
jgi:(1->4)-alpha-D-glucan 1-alpha-D-glucosylmutase